MSDSGWQIDLERTFARRLPLCRFVFLHHLASPWAHRQPLPASSPRSDISLTHFSLLFRQHSLGFFFPFSCPLNFVTSQRRLEHRDFKYEFSQIHLERLPFESFFFKGSEYDQANRHRLLRKRRVQLRPKQEVAAAWMLRCCEFYQNLLFKKKSKEQRLRLFSAPDWLHKEFIEHCGA